MRSSSLIHPCAGLSREVVDRLLEVTPPRIVYLSCNPVTQARDIELLQTAYTITAHRGYNVIISRTPHIEHLVVLDRVITPYHTLGAYFCLNPSVGEAY